MKFFMLTFFLGLLSAANAHFTLQYPGPRGLRVANNQLKFCGGHNDVTTNKTTFPLSGGFFKIQTGHPGFTTGVIISTVDNPRSFDNFTVNGQQQLVRNFAKEEGAGEFCIPLNISAANIPGVKDGSNVTIQVIFNGGDGSLYQCADLTLSANLTSPPDQTCQNTTNDDSNSNSSIGGDSDNSGSGSLSVAHGLSTTIAIGLGFIGIVAALL